MIHPCITGGKVGPGVGGQETRLPVVARTSPGSAAAGQTGRRCVPWAVTVAAADAALEKGEAGPGAPGAGGS